MERFNIFMTFTSIFVPYEMLLSLGFVFSSRFVSFNKLEDVALLLALFEFMGGYGILLFCREENLSLGDI